MGMGYSANQAMAGGSFVEIKSNEIQRNNIIGKGSYGKVYKATWGDRCVAVKVMETDTEREINAFRNELQQLSKVSHKNIVTLFGACTEMSNYSLVMEYAENGSLHNLLHNTTIAYTTAHAINWAQQCAEAIDYLHSMEPKPLVHRDLKPLNLLLFNQGETLKICDFGTVRDKATIMTRNTGSIAWMAPEMFDADIVYTEKCDVYSFGIILWEIIHRVMPFRHLECQQLMMAVCSGIDERCPKLIKDLITKCWHPSPEKRPSMKAVMEQLLNINEPLPSHSRFVEDRDETNRSDLAAALQKQPCHLSRLHQSNDSRNLELELPSSRGHQVIERGFIEMMDNHSLYQLHSAAQDGDSEAVERFLQGGASVDVKDCFGVTPLHYAADSGHEAIVRLLLEHGANINETNNDQATPLYLAALNGHVGVVNILLETGADFNLAARSGMTPLITAARNGHRQVVRKLINDGAGVNTTDITGCAPLHYAASNGHEEIVEILYDARADFDVVNNCGETPLHYAAEKGYAGIVQTLLCHATYRIKQTENGVTPLHIAVLKGHTTVVRVLLDRGTIELDVPTSDGVTPLHFAAGIGNNEIVDILLRLRSQTTVHDQDNGGRTPLHYAARQGHGEIVQNLLNNGASIDARENNDLTPLHYATLKGRDKIVNILLKAGAVVDEGWLWMKNELANAHIQKPLLTVK